MSALSIEWVNHAGFLVSGPDFSLLCDPWLDGTVFDDGWSLLSPTAFTPDRFAEITHLWISHEHPDHFSPRAYTRLPAEIRRRITVLHQESKDTRVLDFFRKLGFGQCVPIERSGFRLGSDAVAFCESHRFETNDDSLLALQTSGRVLLNLNDCVIPKEELPRILAAYGRPDVLLSQFSYAGWAGNPEDLAYRRRIAAQSRDLFFGYVEAFQPRTVIPAASFSWFSNEDNYFLNDGSNRVSDTAAEIARRSIVPIVLYPGDRWEVGAPWSNDASLARYAADYERMTASPALTRSPGVPKETLRASGEEFARKLRSRNNALLLRLLPEARIFVSDHGCALGFSAAGVRAIGAGEGDCDISLRSEPLQYCFANLWGGDTLNINGRFRKPQGGRFGRFRIYFAIASLNNIGKSFGFPFLLGNAATVGRKLLEYSRRFRGAGTPAQA